MFNLEEFKTDLRKSRGEAITLLYTIFKDSIVLAYFLAIIQCLMAYYMWNRAISIVDSNVAALYLNLLPLFIALLGYVLLKEPLTLGDIIGGILIVIGSTIAVIK